ncbi:MAG TPA: hypothetical protein VG188_08500 [Solirubrobacteraceae bacterium]|nr:hypothetical protein [Solirubrobacteraceae bacterium]
MAKGSPAKGDGRECEEGSEWLVHEDLDEQRDEEAAGVAGEPDANK